MPDFHGEWPFKIGWNMGFDSLSALLVASLFTTGRVARVVTKMMVPAQNLAENGERRNGDAMGKKSRFSKQMGLFKIMVPQNCPYAALSRTLRALSCCSKINIWNYDHVFVCIFRTKDEKGNCIQNIIKTHLYSGLFDPSQCLWSTHSLKSVWSCDIAESSPFWARVWSGRIRLSRTFREPFAPLPRISRISRLKSKCSETNVYLTVALMSYAQFARKA